MLEIRFKSYIIELQKAFKKKELENVNKQMQQNKIAERKVLKK